MTGTLSRQIQERMKLLIPWGSSTTSKMASLTPEEPGVIVRGKGCRVWDADGREFIDFRNSLGPVTLGYAFEEVDEAIKTQLASGIVFGHPHPLEGEVAELLHECIPCAEQVRFLKTGGEAVAACIKLARAFTGRDHIVQIGYNGWLNSLAPAGMILPGQPVTGIPLGIPAAVSQLHHACGWNDREKISRLFADYNGQIAAVVVSADYVNIAAGREFYPFLREITRVNGTVLIYDEIVTGFRVALGGVQEYFKIMPDMAVFAKGIANGMPLSVYTGRKDIMEKCLKAMITSTYGGETLSLAAAKATIQVYRKQEVVPHLWHMGERMWSGLNRLFKHHGFPAECKGFWPCAALVLNKDARKELWNAFMRAAYQNGVSLYSVNYVNFSHQAPDIDEALERLDRGLKTL